MRGLAYLADDRGSDTAQQLQKILDHRRIVGFDPIGAMAHLQLARASVMAKDRIKSESSYKDFLRLWKNADPGIPVLKEARIEYRKLQ